MLRHRVAANLTAKMAEVNAKKNLAQRDPSEKEVAKWIQEAAELAPVMTY